MTRIVGAILMRDDKLLLGLRAPHKKSAPETWDTVGGHVEPGESDEAAMIRKVEEETGVTPLEFSLLTTAKWQGVESYSIYRVTRWTGGEPEALGDEHTRLDWFSPEEAAGLDRLAAEDYRALFRGLQR